MTSYLNPCLTTLDLMLNALSRTNFDNVYHTHDLDTKTNTFYELLNTCSSIIPRTIVTFSSNDKPWITPVLKSLINQRWHAYRTRNFPLYNVLKTKVKTEILRAKQKWANKSYSSSKSLWNVASEVRGTKTRTDLGPIVDSFSNISQAANHINDLFCSVFTSDNTDETIPHSNSVSDWCPLLEPHEVCQLLQRLPCKATGSDLIPSRLYKEGALFLAAPLCHLINSSILSCYVPIKWKIANIRPIPKTSPACINALRPISLLPLPSKLLEKVILKSIKDYLLTFIDKCQFAYRPYSSTTNALLHLQDRLTTILDEEDAIGAAILSLDFTKAFDTISHRKLIRKLHAFDFPLKFIDWTASYLTDRFQRTVISNTCSKMTIVPSGVPQGSILGPYLFIFYISDLITDTDRNYMMYADDTSIIVKLTKDVSSSEVILRNKFDSIKIKSANINLTLNEAKSKLLICPKRNGIKIDISVRNVENVTSLKLLGVTFSSNLTWDDHIRNILKRCSSRMYALRVLKPICDEKFMFQVYAGLIRSLLEYACPVFMGTSVTLNTQINCLIKRCHRIVHNQECNCDMFDSFQSRRLVIAKTLFFKIESNPDHPLHRLIPHRLPRTNHYFIDFCRTQRKKDTFVIHLALYLNSLR